jgi:hypothetical protein
LTYVPVQPFFFDMTDQQKHLQSLGRGPHGVSAPQTPPQSALKTLKVVFLLIAQPHQTLHSLPIAFEMAARHPNADVHVACPTQSHLDYARSLGRLYPAAKVTYDLLPIPAWLGRLVERNGPGPLERLASLFFSRHYFNQFQAIVVPERTSLYLKRMGVTKPLYIWTRHGAGDRAIGFAEDIKQFDFVLLSGKKVEQRLLERGLITPGEYHMGTYAKFDIVERLHRQQARLFDNDKPIVLYNPHFSRGLTSWYQFGEAILNYFANQDHYNLICAPHYRLFNGHKKQAEALVRRFAKYPNILIDTGSTRSIDMTYTMAADLYLGDVSSQVAEFLIRPRPCIFLNAHHAHWQNNKDYRFWTLGQVIDSPDELGKALSLAFTRQDEFEGRQRAYVAETFEHQDKSPTSPGAADAIMRFLQKKA